MRRTVLLALLIAGCSKGESKPQPAAKAEAPRAANAKPSAEIPDWAPLDVAAGPPVTPVAWVADAKPTLAVFSASWCPGCTASALADRVLVREHGKHYQIGVALQDESDEAFLKSRYARALSGVPVWSEASVAKLTAACQPRVIPSACLFENDKAVWSGDPSEAGAVIDAHKANGLAQWLANAESAETTARSLAQEALNDPSKIAAVVAATHGRVGWQNSTAWRLVDRDSPSPGAV
ncbi:MAG: hypothetical protein H0T65_12915, partial [Deltaproteobacteria bacterium]|nr:hypothetical protein [Deltaproteobacteria bacterium]